MGRSCLKTSVHCSSSRRIDKFDNFMEKNGIAILEKLAGAHTKTVCVHQVQ